jgi:pimeloyl-ACP methyl ester carboxylesterase
MIDSLQHWKSLGRFHDWQGQQVFLVDSADRDPAADEKPVLLLVHGYPTSTWDFSHLWLQLGARFRVVGADLLGLGFSSKPRPHRYCMAEQADLMEFVLQQTGVRQCHVLAHDYGDTVTQELLARDLERPQSRYLSVILLNGGLFPETHHARTMQKLMAGPLGPLLARLTSRSKLLGTFSSVFGPQTRPDEPTLEAVWQLVNYHNGLLVLPPLLGYIAERRQFRERWVNALRQARMPLALVNGSADPVSGAHMVARFREVVGTQHFIRELPGIGHYPQLEAPEAVLNACEVFWRENGVA